MGYRLSKITTRTGDDGTTGLGDGRRVPKDAARVEAMGAVDELNSTVGLLLALALPDSPPTRAALEQIQHDLLDLGAELAVPGGARFDGQSVLRLEQQLDALNALLPPLREFVLPGGGPAAAACHFARTVCRRAERRCWTLVHAEPAAAPSSQALCFLNRLSDLLFVFARLYARAGGGPEVLWRHERADP